MWDLGLLEEMMLSLEEYRKLLKKIKGGRKKDDMGRHCGPDWVYNQRGLLRREDSPEWSNNISQTEELQAE